MGIDDRLRQLKKEREARNRSIQVEEAWQKIKKTEEELSVKQKLEKLINLTAVQKSREKKAQTPPFEPFERTPRDPFRFLENPYSLNARYGQIPISIAREIPGEVLAFLSREPAFGKLSLDSALFLDLETTGLAGGTGTVPFLVGMGSFREDKFVVSQFFLHEMAEEQEMIRELARFLGEGNFRSVITYNGKAFDIPLLETRFTLCREPFALRDLPHLDFLFSARSLWKHKYESCRLFDLAREIVRADRSEDIPSAEIPLRYFQFLRSGDFSLIEPVLYHNQEDILSLLGVVIAGSLLLSRTKGEAVDEDVDAMDLYGIARLFESAGDVGKSVPLFEKALEGRLTNEVSLTVKKKLSYHFKKSRDWEKAVSLWEGTTQSNELYSFRELAIHYEHRMKKYEEAIRISEEGLALSLGSSLHYEADFRKRIERLRGKVSRKTNKP